MCELGVHGAGEIRENYFEPEPFAKSGEFVEFCRPQWTDWCRHDGTTVGTKHRADVSVGSMTETKSATHRDHQLIVEERDAASTSRIPDTPDAAEETDASSSLLHGNETGMRNETLSTRTKLVDDIAIVGALFSVFALRMFNPLLWSKHIYIPILSPVYRQQEHWAASTSHTLAILAHVACGVVMVAVITLQLDADTRKGNPVRHRWLGRLYVIAGFGALAALRVLRSTSGAGSGQHADPLMTSFIDASTLG